MSTSIPYLDLLQKVALLEGELSVKDRKIESLEKDNVKKSEDDDSNQKVLHIVHPRKEESKPTFVIPFGNYEASLVDGVWIYKANDSIPITGKKPVAPKYKDPVQFKIMEEYETLSEKSYQNQLGTMVKEIVSFLKDV